MSELSGWQVKLVCHGTYALQYLERPKILWIQLLILESCNLNLPLGFQFQIYPIPLFNFSLASVLVREFLHPFLGFHQIGPQLSNCTLSMAFTDST